jgi:hypothetical protein
MKSWVPTSVLQTKINLHILPPFLQILIHGCLLFRFLAILGVFDESSLIRLNLTTLYQQQTDEKVQKWISYEATLAISLS